MYFVGGRQRRRAERRDRAPRAWKFALSEATPGGAIRRGMTYWPGDAAARAARARHDERRQARAARREDRQAGAATSASSIS